ncbi:uncharacterized protein BO72DRAFT_457491 [Aspergillus fijiensis CBS 313.89]|uniref:Ankyrin n=1 Tax=Aspergillus fijiensis CBS 313.89 TaxID=1448319 RepID=A0A8G1W0S7_9EURO|nr:uncharacterized protein BO72DRAFT_457491 [Aspergillus fijiensis CBS 313.89]RAK78903.1 hypothetical protein BO72DRAFT_457491 [Aspergillus fijiensis CBS 313.89]
MDNIDRVESAQWCGQCGHLRRPASMAMEFRQLRKQRMPALPEPEGIQILNGANLIPCLMALWKKAELDLSHLERMLRPDNNRGVGAPTLRSMIQRRFCAVLAEGFQNYQVSADGRLLQFCCYAGHQQAPIGPGSGPAAAPQVAFPNVVHHALAHDSLDEIKLAVALGLEAHRPVYWGYTLLGAAILARAHKVIRYLFERDDRFPGTAKPPADQRVNWIGSDYYGPLELALVLKDKQLIWLLLELVGGGNTDTLEWQHVENLCVEHTTSGVMLKYLVTQIGVDLLASNANIIHQPVQLKLSAELAATWGDNAGEYLLRRAIRQDWAVSRVVIDLVLGQAQASWTHTPATDANYANRCYQLLNDPIAGLDDDRPRNAIPLIAWATTFDHRYAFDALLKQPGFDLNRAFVAQPDGDHMYTPLTFAVRMGASWAVDKLLNRSDLNLHRHGPMPFRWANALPNTRYPSPFREIVDLVEDRASQWVPGTNRQVGLDNAMIALGRRFRIMATLFIGRFNPQVHVGWRTGETFPEWVLRNQFISIYLDGVVQLLHQHGYIA